MNIGKHLFPEIDQAYAFYNEELFGNKLPTKILFNIVSRKKAKGYFRRNRLMNQETQEVIHEIALMPEFFKIQTDEETLSTLVHEMIHLEEELEGKKSKSHHTKRWVKLMEERGLIPYNIKKPNYQCGHSVTHKIGDGSFRESTKKLIASGFKISWVTPENFDLQVVAAQPKPRIKTRKYICPDCGLEVRGEYDLKIKCGTCDIDLE